MSSVGSSTSIDKTELQKRLSEINDQIKNLSDEKKTIELKLKEKENFEENQSCIISSNSNSNTQSSSNTTNNNSILEEEEEESLSKNKISADNQDSIQQEQQTFDYEILKNVDTLKSFFEKSWNVDFFGYGIDYPGGQVTDREKAAYIKMAVFLIGDYIDIYDEKIDKASLRKKDYDAPKDQLKAALEKLMDALITRSKVLELFERCGKEAGKLYEHVKGVSRLQIARNNHSYFSIKVLYCLLSEQEYFIWDYEKKNDEFEYYDFYQLYNGLLDFLKDNLILTEEQREILRSILKTGKDFCDK